MRVPTLILVTLIGLLLGQGVAAAEKVKTNQSTKLLSRPGEQAKVILKLKSGKSMTLLSKEGRWYKVRVDGRTGYVSRSTVDTGDDGDIARNTRRRPFVEGRGKKRGSNDGAPDDRVGADAQGDNAPDTSEDEEEEEEPAPKAKKTATAAKTKAKPAEDDEEEEEPAPKGKKAPAKTPPAKTKAAAKGGDEEDEEEDEEPAPKGKTPPARTKAAAKGGDDEEEEDEKDVKPKATAKPAPKGGDGDDEEDAEDEDKPKAAAKPAPKGGDGDGEDEESPDLGSKRPAGGAEDDEDKRPRARVTKKVGVLKRPDDDADDALFVVLPTDTLFPGESENGWTYVKNAEGDGGWVPSDVLEINGSGAGKRAIDVRARTGLMFIQQAIRTTGSDNLHPPDNYNVITRAVMVSLGGGILIPRGKMLIGGELTYDLAKTLGGVPYDPDGKDGSMPAVAIPISFHNVNVRAQLGIDFKKPSGMALIGRLGYHYQGFLVANVADTAKNPAQLPSEVIKGPTIGAALTIPMMTPKIGLKFALDAMLFGGSVTQTKGLEDGASPAAQMINLEAGLSYHLKSLDLQAIYDLDYMGVDFGAPVTTSNRVHMGTNVKRTDIFHLVTFGISKGF